MQSDLHLQPLFLPQCTPYLDPHWMGLAYKVETCGRFLNVHCIVICSFSALTAAAINLRTYLEMRKNNRL